MNAFNRYDDDAREGALTGGPERLVVLGGLGGVVFGVVAVTLGALAAFGVLLAGIVGCGLGFVVHGVIVGRYDAGAAWRAFRREPND